MLDCIVIGGGPAGLTAAIYLARFHLDICVVDAGQSRANWISLTRNHAGYPDGISGPDLLEAMRTQAQKYGVSLIPARVSRAEKCDGSFAVEYGSGEVLAKTILLATGVINRCPQIDEDLHNEALRSGHIRYCAVCDGYEVTDKPVAVIGTGQAAIAEALFLRSYTKDVTLIASTGGHKLSSEQRDAAAHAGILLVQGPAIVKAIGPKGIEIQAADIVLSFASVYPALGSDINNSLAVALGAATSDVGCIVIDDHQRTSVEGLYAAGDVVIGLDQISHAMGEGGVAATTIRNDLAKQAPMLR